jgi:hypothetical protein
MSAIRLMEAGKSILDETNARTETPGNGDSFVTEENAWI